MNITQKEFKFKCKFNKVFKFKYNFKNILVTLFAYYNGCKVNRDALGAQHELATLNLFGWMKKKVQDFPKPVLYCIPISNLPKGQSISKGLFFYPDFFQKMKKKNPLKYVVWYLRLTCFRLFFGRIEDTKSSSKLTELYWWLSRN